MEQYACIPNVVFQKSLNADSITLLAVFFCYLGKGKNTLFPYRKDLIEAIGVGKKKYNRMLRDLKDTGLIAVQQKRSERTKEFSTSHITVSKEILDYSEGFILVPTMMLKNPMVSVESKAIMLLYSAKAKGQNSFYLPDSTAAAQLGISLHFYEKNKRDLVEMGYIHTKPRCATIWITKPITVPMEENTATPTEGTAATPTEGTAATPMEGTAATPTEETTATPTEGTAATPTEGTAATPTKGTAATPTEGTAATTTEGTTYQYELTITPNNSFHQSERKEQTEMTEDEESATRVMDTVRNLTSDWLHSEDTDGAYADFVEILRKSISRGIKEGYHRNGIGLTAKEYSHRFETIMAPNIQIPRDMYQRYCAGNRVIEPWAFIGAMAARELMCGSLRAKTGKATDISSPVKVDMEKLNRFMSDDFAI